VAAASDLIPGVAMAASLGGGVLRDVLVNEVPLVMRPGTLYATAPWCGALVLVLRLLAIRYRLRMSEFRSPP
jgi:uncharacterized membrane protein YeiH